MFNGKFEQRNDNCSLCCVMLFWLFPVNTGSTRYSLEPCSTQGISPVLQVLVSRYSSLVSPANTGSTRFIVVLAGLPCSAIQFPSMAGMDVADCGSFVNRVVGDTVAEAE